MRTPFVLVCSVALVACSLSEPGPEPEPEPPSTLQDWPGGARTMAFGRVADLSNHPVGDIQLDVSGTAVAVTTGAPRRVWVDDGSGWRILWEPNDMTPTAACLDPSGERVFVGLVNSMYAVLRTDGTIEQPPTSIPGRGEAAGWPVRQCRWWPTGGDYVFVTFSAPSQIDGDLLYGQITPGASPGWFSPPVSLTDQTGREVWPLGPYAFDGLSLAVSASGSGSVTVGAAYGPSPGLRNERNATGRPSNFRNRDWEEGWGIGLPLPHVDAYGRARVFARNAAGTGASLHRDEASGLWGVSVLTPPGYRGVTHLDAPGVTGVGHALGIDAERRLWIGTTTGLYRSTGPM